MRYDVLMFIAMLSVLTVTGVHALLPPQSQPVSERVALLEQDYEYLSQDIEEIKELLEEHTNKVEKWIVIALGLLITGDRGLVIFQRLKNKKEK